MKRKGIWISHFICIITILGVFAMSALLLCSVGVNVYKNIILSNTENFELRTSLSYIATKIRQSNQLYQIDIVEKDGINVLVLYEEVEGVTYETCIYTYNNKLYELHQYEGSDYNISDGIDVMEIKDLSFEFVQDNLIKLTSINQKQEQETMFITIQSRRKEMSTTQ